MVSDADLIAAGARRVERVTVYVLRDPRDGTARYVGATSQSLGTRLGAHVRDARARRGPNSRVRHWLAGIDAAGLRPIAEPIEEVPPGGDWQSAETFWIAAFRATGAEMLNFTAGGLGIAGTVRTAAERQAIAEKLRTGATLRCETCATPFWRKRNKIAKGEARFCSRACYGVSCRRPRQ